MCQFSLVLALSPNNGTLSEIYDKDSKVDNRAAAAAFGVYFELNDPL